MRDIAIPSVGREVLLIKDNQVIGQGTVDIIRGWDFAGVRLTEETFKALFQADAIEGLSRKDLFIRFSPVTGGFLETMLPCMVPALEGTSVVDSFNFGYGWVPALFKDVPGFGAKLAIPDAA